MVLSAIGTAYQCMLRNPLVSPDILGVSAGAWLGDLIWTTDGVNVARLRLILIVSAALVTS